MCWTKLHGLGFLPQSSRFEVKLKYQQSFVYLPFGSLNRNLARKEGNPWANTAKVQPAAFV